MKTILIIDDSENMRLTIKDMVSRNGYWVAGEAGDAKSGIEMFKRLNPDIVTLDVTMPGPNGIEALRQIMGINPNALVVMVSAMGQDLYIKDAIMAGAKGYIVKPFGERQILDALAKLF